jgi:5-carboxymethyl-2-hydroxymuconate isomerase
MPHIIIECSANLPARADLRELVDRVHATALATGVFPIGGLRTRVAQREVYAIADGDPANAFVHIVLRIGLDETFASSPLGISLELQEIDPDFSFKKNNLHEYASARGPIT